MVLAGAGVDHEELVRLGTKYFGGLKGNGDEGERNGGGGVVAESRYRGGEARNVVSAEKVSIRTLQRWAGGVGGWLWQEVEKEVVDTIN